eukprot:1161678-Pelagomonas_calceolata.AAC.3
MPRGIEPTRKGYIRCKNKQAERTDLLHQSVNPGTMCFSLDLHMYVGQHASLKRRKRLNLPPHRVVLPDHTWRD